MKITDIHAVVVQAPGRTLVNVLVETDEGITGLGESGLQRRWKGIQGVLEHFKRWMIGQDPMRTEHLWQRMFRGGFYPADRLVGSAIAGVDIALWDIKGQVLGVPIYELLGGRYRDHIECFTLPENNLAKDCEADPDEDYLKRATGSGDPEAVRELARRFSTEGHKYLRFGVAFQDKDYYDPRPALRKLVSVLEIAREAGGEDLELMVDLHGRIDMPDSIWFCKEVEPLNMYVIEDPVRAESPQAYRHLRQHIHVPIAAGEQWAHKWEFRQVIEEDLVDFIRTDICIAGGITEAKKIAAMAEAHHIRMLFHNPLGPVCLAASLHLDTALPNCGPQEVLHIPSKTLPDVYERSFELLDGSITIPSGKGLGVTFKPEIAARYPGLMTEPVHLHRADGAYTNS